MTKVAILTLPGFNELDNFVAFSLLNRAQGITATLAGPFEEAVSMNGVGTATAGSLDDAATADAVIVGSGLNTRRYAEDPAFMSRLGINPARQLVAAQCSGALILAKLGLLDHHPVCTDDKTRPWIEALGLEVAMAPLSVVGRVATAGGCLASQYLATWLLLRLAGEAETLRALSTVVPVGESEAYLRRLIGTARAADPQGLALPLAAEA